MRGAFWPSFLSRSPKEKESRGLGIKKASGEGGKLPARGGMLFLPPGQGESSQQKREKKGQV